MIALHGSKKFPELVGAYSNKYPDSLNLVIYGVKNHL